MAYVLAGGRGTRLMELTDTRAKPAVYFGGKSRIIDFALSNALNSGIRRIGVATQYKAHSLIRHLQRGWNFFRPERNESFDILPASQRVGRDQWYAGTADAVFQNIDIIEGYAPQLHRAAGRRPHLQDGLRADAAAARRAGRRRHRRLHRGAAHGGDRLRRDGMSTPTTASSSSWRSPPTRRHAGQARTRALASMGIYVFETAVPVRPAAPRRRRPGLRATISARTSSPTSSARQGGRAPLRPLLRALRRGGRRPTGATSARWTPTGRPTSTSPTSCRASTCTTRTGRSGPTARSCRPRSSSMTRTARRGSAISSPGLGRLHRLRRQREALAAVHRRPHPFLRLRRGRGDAALRRYRPRRPADATSSSTAACASRPAWWSARTRSSTRTLPPHRERRLPDHPADDRHAG